MSLRVQFVKCTLYVVLYLTVCFALLKLKQRFYLTPQQAKTLFFANDNGNKPKFIPDVVPAPTASNTVNSEIKLLERDEMNGQFINLQESAMLLQQVSNVCKKYHLKTPLKRRHFLFNSKHKSLYCWIRKVASTSFTKLFSDMSNRPASRDYYREVDYLAPQSLKELRYAVNKTDTFKLLVVRHPFERLVSSYRDRINDNTKHTAQAWIYAKQIFRLTRPELFHSNTTSGNFQQKIFTRNKRLKIVPSFKEFLVWLLQYPKEDDVHWSRYYTHCAVCNVKYNYILKLDDYTYGQINYIFSKLGLDKNKVYLPKLEETLGGHTDFETTCEHLATLSHGMILRLYERYKIDFEMYNYDLKKYMFCVNRKKYH